MSSDHQNDKASEAGTEQARMELMRLAAIVESSDDAIIGKDLDSIITSWNKGAEKIFGYTSAEMVGTSITRLIPIDRQDEENQILGKIKRGESLDHFETVRQTKDGRMVAVSISASPIKDATGKIVGVSKIARDISERRHAEEALRKISQQETGRKRTQIVWELVVIFALGAITYVVLDYTNVLSPPLDKLVLKFKSNLDDLVGPPIILLLGFLIFSYRRWKDAQNRFIEQANIQEGLRLLHGEQEKRIQERTAELIRANDALHSEIAERKLAEEARGTSETRYHTLFDCAPDGIVIVDSKGYYVDVNTSICRMLGYTRDEFIGLNATDIVTPAETSHIQTALDVIKSKSDYQREWQFRRKDGSVFAVDTVATAMPDGNLLAIIRDITERKKLEEQFRQSQKMDGIGQLAGGVAHDFNNILAVIQMQAGLLQTSGGLSVKQTEFAEEIGITVQRAATLTRQLLLFSRREVFQPRDLDLSESITSTAKMLQRILGEDIQMHLKLAPQPMFIHADAGMMDQVLMNLAVNARDAMPNGGQLVIETSGVEFDEFAASQSAQTRVGSFVRLSVSDSGCGILPENLSKIFEPFFTTKDVGKGTGLGLATVFGIVQQHQGWINVYSEINHGTTFGVYLPRLAKNDGIKSVLAAPSAVRGGNETILLAEDDPALRLSVRMAISRLGYRILEAPTGVKALEVWKENRAEIRLLLTDLVMPDGMTGKDLAQRILQEDPKMKVIYMSGYSAEVAGKGFPLKEGVNFLAKPFAASKLAQMIRESLDAKI